MADIKSAREIAMEKIARMGEPTEQERLEWKYVPEGEKLAAQYLRQDIELQPELAQIDRNALPYVTKGISNILVKNIILPENEVSKKAAKRALEGIKIIKADKVKTENVLSQIRHIFNHYAETGDKQKKQAYTALKQDFQAKVEQALRQQMGTQAAGVRIDVEKQPQFQEEWRKLKNQLDAQYVQLLTEYKQQLDQIK